MTRAIEKNATIVDVVWRRSPSTAWAICALIAILAISLVNRVGGGGCSNKGNNSTSSFTSFQSAPSSTVVFLSLLVIWLMWTKLKTSSWLSSSIRDDDDRGGGGDTRNDNQTSTSLTTTTTSTTTRHTNDHLNKGEHDSNDKADGRRSQRRVPTRMIETDVHLMRVLARLDSFATHDGAKVRDVVKKTEEFYRRYARLFHRPRNIHIRHEYTLLYDLRTDILNTIHSLFFAKPPSLCKGARVAQVHVHARLSRMMRALRHKYADELLGTYQTTTVPYDPRDDPHVLYV